MKRLFIFPILICLMASCGAGQEDNSPDAVEAADTAGLLNPPPVSPNYMPQDDSAAVLPDSVMSKEKGH